MNDNLNKLKNKNVLELLGDYYIRNKAIAIGILVAIIAIPIIISLIIGGVSKSNAINYQKELSKEFSTIESTYLSVGNLLKEEKKYYKEHSKYQSSYDKLEKDFNGLKSDVEKVEKNIKNEKYKKVNKLRKSKEIDTAIAKFTDSNKQLFTDINDVYKISNEIIENTNKSNTLNKKLSEEDTDLKKRLSEVDKNGKTKSVKDKANKYYKAYADINTNFTKAFSKEAQYDKTLIGKYDLVKLKAILNDQSKITNLMAKHDSTKSDFDNYYKELQEQYYTVVTKHYSEKGTKTFTELNPMYKEWYETETYQDTVTKYKTETYTERVYKGSSVSNGTRRDIYANETRTRQVPYQETVTKTREVLKNNGQPKMIPVPYTEYTHYYELEKVNDKGSTKEQVKVGDKNAKMNFNISSWDYKDTEQVGYTVWKQKWNDNSDIKKGKNLNAKME